MAMNRKADKLNNIIKRPAIASLIQELDALGYELYIKPKPARFKDLSERLAESIKYELKEARERKKGKN
jgi:hypothetical protein